MLIKIWLCEFYLKKIFKKKQGGTQNCCCMLGKPTNWPITNKQSLLREKEIKQYMPDPHLWAIMLLVAQTTTDLDSEKQ